MQHDCNYPGPGVFSQIFTSRSSFHKSLQRQQLEDFLMEETMEYTIENLIDGLTYAQLLKMQFDLTHGGLYLKRLIDGRIKMLENQNRKVCVTCGAEVGADSEATYSILFGPVDFRKKATCCGMDCLEQFMVKLKQFEGIKTTLNKKEKEQLSEY